MTSSSSRVVVVVVVVVAVVASLGARFSSASGRRYGVPRHGSPPYVWRQYSRSARACRFLMNAHPTNLQSWTLLGLMTPPGSAMDSRGVEDWGGRGGGGGGVVACRARFLTGTRFSRQSGLREKERENDRHRAPARSLCDALATHTATSRTMPKGESCRCAPAPSSSRSRVARAPSRRVSAARDAARLFSRVFFPPADIDGGFDAAWTASRRDDAADAARDAARGIARLIGGFHAFTNATRRVEPAVDPDRTRGFRSAVRFFPRIHPAAVFAILRLTPDISPLSLPLNPPQPPASTCAVSSSGTSARG